MRNQLQHFEKKDLSPIDIVYEPTLDTKKPILCFYALEIYMAYQTCYEKMRMGGKINVSSTARQCPYRNNFFIKTAEKMEKHISCCSGQADSNFSFDNGKVIDYQDNYKKIGDLPLAIYYDFETTTGCVVFFDANIYVVSYCIIVAFHPDVDLPRLYIFRSYDQTREQLRILRQFKGIFFADKLNFNQKTFAQLQDVGFAVENREKNTALSEMFSIKLKFTVDCLIGLKGTKTSWRSIELKELFLSEILPKLIVAFAIFHCSREPKTAGVNIILRQNIYFWRTFTMPMKCIKWELIILKFIVKN